jgi:hypothetical protein
MAVTPGIESFEPQEPEQHAFWHAYAPAAVVVHAEIVPAMVQARPPPLEAIVPHVPACVAVAPLQAPPQHCVALVQESLFCLQNEEAVLQVPLTQAPEQHALFAPFGLHALPDARHTPPLFVTQTLPLHLPLQQSLPLVHAAFSALHVAAMHLPRAPQLLEQHCALLVHVVFEPSGMHGPERLPHLFGSKRPHDCPVGQPPPFVPHVMVPPQPSAWIPQVKPVSQTVFFVQDVPHWFGALRPHVCPAGHPPPFVPHVTVPPQPSDWTPQVRPASHAVFFTHAPHLFGSK